MENSLQNQIKAIEENGGFGALFQRTKMENPNPEDLETLRELLDSFPQFFQTVDSISQKLLYKVFHQAIKDSPFHKECFLRQIQEMKTEFGYKTSSLIEKLLIDEILISWLRLLGIEGQYHAYLMSQHNMTDWVYWDKRLASAQKRFLRSSKTLVRVRKDIIKTQIKTTKMPED